MAPGSPWILSFDAAWYIGQHRDDVDLKPGTSNAEALDHFVRLGGGEGYRPNRGFDEDWYRARYQDVAAGIQAGAYSCGFHHFVLHGFEEGRLANGLPVDEVWYRATYDDVDRDIELGRLPTAHSHYTVVGCAELRDPHPAFSETWYRRMYAEADRSVRDRDYLCGYEHFLERGEKDGHRPHPLFDEAYYRQANPDVRLGIWDGSWRSGFEHLIVHGLVEKRPWRTLSPLGEAQLAITRNARIDLQGFLASTNTLRFDRHSKPEVSIVLVLYNQAELTLQCLESLVAQHDAKAEVIVVDNASSDLTDALLKRIDGITAIRMNRNEGFVGGANRGAGVARGNHLLFLNNDTVVRPGSIRAALDRLESQSHVGAVGARVVRADGRLQEAGSVVWRDGTVEPWGQGEDPASLSFATPRSVDYCTGAFLLVRRDAFEFLGGFRNDYSPAYYEEVDLCFRLRSELGLDTMYEPAAIVHHFVSASDSGCGQQSEDLSRANRIKFIQLNRQTLERQPDWVESSLFAAADRARTRPCVLVIDDFVSLDSYGSGCPRMREIVRALIDLGYFITMYAANAIPYLNPAELGGLSDHDLEIVNHAGRSGFEGFWQHRKGAYSNVIVSRPHNMQWLDALGVDFSPARLIYDAEAFVSPRTERQVLLLGELSPGTPTIDLKEETRLCSLADRVWAVSARDAEMMGISGPVSIVGHAEIVDPGSANFEDRSGIVFVGRIHEEASPNVDGLRWFLTEVLPRANRIVGGEIPFSIIGLRGDMPFPDLPSARFLGTVNDLRPHLHRSRVFVAPARFAAGIPLKVVTASAHGLPTVASSILVRQLGWRSELEIADGGQDDGERFASELACLYSDESRWNRLRDGALDRVRKEHSREAMREAIEASLTGTGRP